MRIICLFLILMSLFACNNILQADKSIKGNNYTINISKDIQTNKGASLVLKIKNRSFYLKGSVDGNLEAKNADVKSFDVFLCTNPDAPLSSALAGSSFSFDRLIFDDTSSVTFVNVPVGTYYAVVSAFDNTVATPMRNNISKPVNYAVDGINKVSISSNTAQVNSDFSITPNQVILEVSLDLRDGVGNNIETSITPSDGGNGLFGNI